MTRALGAKYILLWPSRASEGRGGPWDSVDTSMGSGRNGGGLEGRERK